IVTKSFNWIIEIVLAYFIAKLAQDFGKISRSKSLLLAGLVYVTPAIWFVTGVGGQVDSIVVLLSLVSIWMMFKGREHSKVLLHRNYFFWSGVIFALAFWFKPQIVLTIPAVLLFYFAGKNGSYIWGVLKQTLVWLVAFALLVLLGIYLYFNTVNSIGF